MLCEGSGDSREEGLEWKDHLSNSAAALGGQPLLQDLSLASDNSDARIDELLGLADNIINECIEPTSDDTLRKAIFLLRYTLNETSASSPAHYKALRGAFLAMLTGAMRYQWIEDANVCFWLGKKILEHLTQQLNFGAKPGPPDAEDAELVQIDFAISLLNQYCDAIDESRVQEAIHIYNNVLHKIPATHSKTPYALWSASRAHILLYCRNDRDTDLESAIAFLRKARASIHDQHPLAYCCLVSLSQALCWKFGESADLADLREGISFFEQAEDCDKQARDAFDRGTIMLETFEASQGISRLAESISLLSTSVLLRAPPHPYRHSSLYNLALAFKRRFELEGNVADLEKSIAYDREAMDLRPAPHPGRPKVLNNLSVNLRLRFEQEGNFRDLEEAIALDTEALELEPVPDPDRPLSLIHLAIGLQMRFEEKHSLTDLDECIALSEEALQLLSPISEGVRPVLLDDLLNNLAIALHARFEQNDDISDLEQAIFIFRDALQRRPAAHPERPALLNNLAIALRAHFTATGDSTDLEDAISFNREALKSRPPSHPDRCISLDNLSRALWTLYRDKSDPLVLDESILLCREALTLRPPPYPHRSELLNNLAISLSARFDLEGNPKLEDLQESMAVFQEAATYESGPLFPRLQISKNWAMCCHVHQQREDALAAYRTAIELLPRLASLDMDMEQRHSVLQYATEVGCNAARCAIELEDLEMAVTFLSTGRTTFWSQALHLRSPIDELQAVEPNLAQKLRAIATDLEQASQSPKSTSIASAHRKDLRYHTLAGAWQQTLEEVRQLQGFEDFLMPKPFSALQKCASNGPVILLNASKYGCDGLVITLEGVKHVPLPKISQKRLLVLEDLMKQLIEGTYFNLTELEEIQKDLQRSNARLKAVRIADSGQTPESRFESILEVLWIAVVEPVISAIGLTKTEAPQRLWWCPTGPFAFLPIHAAGVYRTESPDCLSDYAVSSYCSTLQDLLTPPPRGDIDFKLLAVIQPEAPGGSNLPETLEELNKIISHLPQPSSSYLVEQVGTKKSPTTADQVLSVLPTISFAHFGCHGTQNLQNPLESCLLLSGGSLSISSLIQCRLSHASLAYLSACETAIGDKKQPDESMHLAATMLFAGFRGVVGTMWSIFDEDAPIVADIFYGYLFRNGTKMPPDATEASYALHLAVKELRKQGKEYYHWVPYVHFGI